MIVFLAKCVGVFVAAFVAVSVMQFAVCMPVIYWRWRKSHPRWSVPLKMFLDQRDRLLAISVDKAQRQLDILREYGCPEVIFAAEKTVQQVRQAHEADGDYVKDYQRYLAGHITYQQLHDEAKMDTEDK